jgi:hypothetical protein
MKVTITNDDGTVVDTHEAPGWVATRAQASAAIDTMLSESFRFTQCDTCSRWFTGDGIAIADDVDDAALCNECNR